MNTGYNFYGNDYSSQPEVYDPLFILEYKLSKLEGSLNELSAIPLFGTFTAAAKILLGIAQVIASVVAGIFSLLLICSSTAREIFCRSCTHIIHGIANIGFGAILAIPLIGSVMWFSLFPGKPSRENISKGSLWWSYPSQKNVHMSFAIKNNPLDD